MVEHYFICRSIDMESVYKYLAKNTNADIASKIIRIMNAYKHESVMQEMMNCMLFCKSSGVEYLVFNKPHNPRRTKFILVIIDTPWNK